MELGFIAPGFLALVVLAAVHLFANQTRVLGWVWHGRFLSFAAGISFAYVFVGLLPALEKGHPALKTVFEHVIPYFDRHAYVIALFGVLFYYGLHTRAESETRRQFWLGLSGYLLFNFFLGATLSDSNDPEIQPLILFTFAMGMHYFVRDHSASENDPVLYGRRARWCLVGALFAGYLVGYLTHIPDAVVAIVVSFVSGGVLLNALRYELPKREEVGYLYFVVGALFYTVVLMGLNAA